MKIPKLLQNSLLLFSVLLAQFAYAQLPDGFDIKQAQLDAVNKGIPASDVKGYVEYLHHDYLSHKNGLGHPNDDRGVLDMGTIYLDHNSNSAYRPATPNSPQNAYCPNAGFEQGTFANWTGNFVVILEFSFVN